MIQLVIQNIAILYWLFIAGYHDLVFRLTQPTVLGAEFWETYEQQKKYYGSYLFS